jgi:hypothetical protein
MCIAEIRNTTPNGIHKGQLHTLAISNTKNPIPEVSSKVLKMFNEGHFMRRTSPSSITRPHTLAEVIIRNLALKLVYRKNGKGTITCTPHIMPNEIIRLATKGATP